MTGLLCVAALLGMAVYSAWLDEAPARPDRDIADDAWLARQLDGLGVTLSPTHHV